MRTLIFAVSGQKIRQDPDSDFSGIFPGSEGYLKARFLFDREWNGTVKVAEFRRFTSEDPVSVPIRNGECMVPAKVTGGKSWYVKVIGKRGDVIIPTENCRVRQEG